MRLPRLVLMVGLAVSLAVHVWLLRLPAVEPAPAPPPSVIPIVETELALLDPPPPEPVPDEPEPVLEPEPQPEPEPEPEPEIPPQPPMERVAEAPETEMETPGDYAGAKAGEREPDLRINWGSADEAQETLRTGEMVIVVLETGPNGPVIGQEVDLQEGAWQRQPYQPRGTTLYSNRLRVVDQVPAFNLVCRAIGLGVHERLAVLIPMRVERVLAAAQMEAAFRHGLAMRQIDSFAGRFTLRGGRLDFDITHVGSSERSATP